MAWATPITWGRGVTPTHTQLNQDLITNPLSLRSLFDASARVYRTSNQSIPDGARTKISWTSTIWNVGTPWSGGNPTRLTAPITGIYLLTVKAPWAANNQGRRGVGYSINGTITEYDMQFNTAQSGASRENGADLVPLAAGDYVECFCYQSSGGNLNLLGGDQGDAVATLTLVATGTTAPIWTEPFSWTTGDILTPWRLNTHWRDNLLNLRAAKGQAVKLSLADNLSVATGQRSPIPWDVEQFQIGSLWESGSQFRARVAGWYMLLATIEWRTEPGTSTGAFRGVGYRINERSPDYDRQFQSGGQAGVSTNGKALVRLEVDDILECYAYHDSDQSLTINGGLDRTRASLHLVAA